MIKYDVKIIKADLSQHEFIYLIPFSDLHWENPHVDRDAAKGYRDWVLDHPNAYILGVGDWFDMVTKQSTTELYEYGEPGKKIELPTPDTTLDELDEFLQPVADRILAACIGGHELKNMIKLVGSDYMFQLMKRLRIEERYSRDGGVLLIKTAPLSKMDDSFFTTVYTHGWGSARTRGAKIRKLEYLAQGFHADVYVLAHDHTQNLARDNYLEIPTWEQDRVSVHRKLLVSAGAFLGYAGYPLRMGFQPADLGTPRIRFGKRLNPDGTIRKDIHASI